MTFVGELYDFQYKACVKMLESPSFLLAHGLGLGKTVTSIAACEALIDAGEVECALVVCGASLKLQWAEQIEKFTDGALVMVADQHSKPARLAQYRAVKRGSEVEYLIMNYEQVVNDWDYVKLLNFDAIVIDEIVAIKSPGAKRSRILKRLKAPYKYGLTGQPIENRPEDLFSIMEMIDPEVFGEPDEFEDNYIERDEDGKVIRYHNLREMRKRLEPLFDRKTRHDVRDQMPQVVEKSWIIDFDPAAKKLYNIIVKELLHILKTNPSFSTFNVWNHYAGITDGSAQGQIMARISALRMLCDHPGLLHTSANLYRKGSKSGSKYVYELKKKGLLDNLKSTPKLTVTMNLIKEIMEADPNNKVVVFSFYKGMLRRLAEASKFGHAMYNGDMSTEDRNASKKKFTNDPRCRILFSSDAGGIGLDLPVANYLISYDLPWSAGKYIQRLGRIDRLSSEWPEITLCSTLMNDSIEMRIMAMLEEKAAVAEAWLDNKKLDKRGGYTLSLGSLTDFLEASHGIAA